MRIITILFGAAHVAAAGQWPVVGQAKLLPYFKEHANMESLISNNEGKFLF